MANFGDTIFDIAINEDSITQYGKEQDRGSCLVFPRWGFFRRPNEPSVLPHAIGCQSPSPVWNYMLVLLGNQWIIKLF